MEFYAVWLSYNSVEKVNKGRFNEENKQNSHLLLLTGWIQKHKV